MSALGRSALAILSGLLFAWSFPNVAIGWLIFIAPLPLFIAIATSRRPLEAAWNGWLSQTTAWLLMVPWVVRVMSHYGGLPYLTGVLIFIAMCCLLGFYGAAFAWIGFHLCTDRLCRDRLQPVNASDRLKPVRTQPVPTPVPAFHRWLLLPLAWAAIEYARTYLLTGFPWNLATAAIIDYTPLIQIDRFVGHPHHAIEDRHEVAFVPAHFLRDIGL